MKRSGQFRASLDVERMGRLARRWGAAYRRAQAALAEMELWRGTRWQSLCEGSLTLGDLSVIPLVTASDMIDEGKQMKNCVATYIGACLRGECQFWSLRLADQVRISTLQTRVETGRWQGRTAHSDCRAQRVGQFGAISRGSQRRRPVGATSGRAAGPRRYLPELEAARRQPINERTHSHCAGTADHRLAGGGLAEAM